MTRSANEGLRCALAGGRKCFAQGYDFTWCITCPHISEEDRKLVNHAVLSLPSAEAEWIPVSKRLPSEKDGQVLVTKRGEVRTATYSEFSGTWYVGEMCAVGGEDPIAWMPLPKPYREGGEV